MAFSYNVNQVPTTGSIAIYNFKELLKSVGWVVKSSSDGTTYNSSGDQITSGNSGSNGLANNSAWFRIQCPIMGGVTRELCIQRSTANNSQWRIKYSYSAGFTGGSPGATRVPSATDETFIAGTGTDASPTFVSLFGADASYKYHCAAANGADGYMFYSIAYAHNAGALSHIFYMDQIQSDTLHPLDIDGYVFFANSTINIGASNLNGENAAGANTYSPQSWLRKGLSNEVWSSTPALSYQVVNSSSTITVASKLFGVNSFDSKDFGLPIIYMKATNETGFVSGFKGVGRLAKIASTTRANGTPLDLNGVGDKIQIDILQLPWNGTIPIV